MILIVFSFLIQNNFNFFFICSNIHEITKLSGYYTLSHELYGISRTINNFKLIFQIIFYFSSRSRSRNNNMTIVVYCTSAFEGHIFIIKSLKSRSSIKYSDLELKLQTIYKIHIFLIF